MCEMARDKNGHVIVHNMQVHMAVARLYVPGEMFGVYVQHIDGDVTNNHHTNLVWTRGKQRNKKSSTRRYTYTIEGDTFPTASAAAAWIAERKGRDINPTSVTTAAKYGYRCQGFLVTRTQR